MSNGKVCKLQTCTVLVELLLTRNQIIKQNEYLPAACRLYSTVVSTWVVPKARAVCNMQYTCYTCHTCEQLGTFRSMPALAVAGVRWHIGSDDVPLFATFGSAFHAIWIAVILLTSRGVLNMPNQCHHEGRQYIATVVGLLFCFTFGFVVEILLIWEGCKGRHAGDCFRASATSKNIVAAQRLRNTQCSSAAWALVMFGISH